MSKLRAQPAKETSRKHPDFVEEQNHLATTIQEMRQIIDELTADMDERLQKINKARSVRDEVSAYVHSLMKSDHAAKIDEIERTLPNPYFGRIDFREDGAEQFEPFYIGRTKIARPVIHHSSDILVFDWRDPVSAIFYECEGGRATYEVLGRYSYSGDVRLKRQHKIEDGRLLDIADDDMLGRLTNRQEPLIADPFLKERLLQGAGDRLQDIVTSIRSEQNRIIREPLNQVTVIQGVAGSGKSTIGLHRLSYLLYNDKLNPARLAVIAPNRIFLNYISDLLPDLDIGQAKQLTFTDVAAVIAAASLRIEQRQDQPDAVIRWKGSPQLIAVFQAFIDRQLAKFCVKLADLSLFDRQLVITREQQLEKVLEGAQIPYHERLNSLEKYIRFRIRNFLEVLQARLNRGERGISDELLQRVRQETDVFLNKHFRTWPRLELLAAYMAVYGDKPSWKSLKRLGADCAQLAACTLPGLRQGMIGREDLAPLCCLKFLLDGSDHVDSYDHIVVDEGQDLNLLEYMVLRRLSRNQSFTIMGDTLQGIRQGGLDNWQSLLREVFGEARSHYYEVNYSYRSAKEIVDLFNRVMPAGRSKAIPVYAIGRTPRIVRAASAGDCSRRLAAAIAEFKQLGCRSIGIISRGEEESIAVYEALKEMSAAGGDLHLLDAAAAAYRGGVTVAPVRVAKGLEFDGVLITNASDREFDTSDLDAKLLYVALSRAMYYLRIFYQGRLTPLLQKSLSR